MNFDFNEFTKLAVSIASFYGFYKLFRLTFKPKLREIDTELLNRLDRIYYLKQQYVKTQELLWDMDLTNPNELKGIELEWQSACGEKRDANIWTDGKSRTTKNCDLQLRRGLMKSISTSIKSLI